jgi:mannose-1-phosphate guanylyltransferase
MKTYVVIMAGGIGSRFWPVSRKELPKQFLDVMGVGKSLLRITYERFARHFDEDKILIVTNSDYKYLVKNHIPEIDDSQILLEPSAKNTAPCIAYAAYKILSQDPDANCIVAPSDHLILNEEEFISKVNQAVAYTDKNDVLVTLGIKPSRPDTGYGYIQYIDNRDSEEIKKVKIFTEKPSKEIAESFIKSGDFLWNAGIFIWNNRSILAAIKRYTPEIHSLFEKKKDLFGTEDELKTVEEIYPMCRNISIDYGIMEKAENVYVIPSEFGWSDLGTWKSLYTERDQDNDFNVIHGERVMAYNTSNSIVFTNSDKLIVTNGIKNLIVVDSDDVLLICDIDKEQEVKRIVNDVKTKYKNEYS